MKKSMGRKAGGQAENGKAHQKVDGPVIPLYPLKEAAWEIPFGWGDGFRLIVELFGFGSHPKGVL